MKVLVTGGAGFIGNHLILRLLADGHQVDTVDVVNDYYDPVLKEARLKRLPDSVQVFRVDIADRSALEPIMKAGSYDAIAHLAAQAGVRYSLEHPEVYVDSNYVGSFNIFDLAKQYDVPHVLFASTSSVYGTSKAMPFTEDDPVATPMSIYAATKRGCELLGFNYHHLYGLHVTCLRFFSVYGPWGRPDMALYIFANKMLAGEPIDVYNYGKMKRDFTYVMDIVDGFSRALTKPMGFEIINLGNGNSVELLDYIGHLESELGMKADMNMMPIQPGDVPESLANIDKARDLLGYEPQTMVAEGIKEFVAWYREYNQCS